MKTVKLILTISILALMTSCGAYYRMVTTLGSNGKVYRELYALGDSAFMAGDTSHHPFLFEPSPDWNINRYDSAFTYDFFGNEGKLNVKISKATNSIENYSKNIRRDTDKISFAAPEESLLKKTGWFYTNYSLKVIYKKITYDVPIPVDDYLNKEEQILWTQGGLCNYKVMNGIEMNDYLSEINDKFLKWYGRNLFEFSLKAIKNLAGNQDLDRDKENIYKKWTHSVKLDTIDVNPETVCTALDSFYKTSYFSKLYNANHETLDSNFNQQSSIANINSVVGNVISYELVIPGKLLQTNAPVHHSDTLIWKIDGIRLLFDDYSLDAEYRVVNQWVFLSSGLLVIVSIVSVAILIKRRRSNVIETL